MTNAAKHKVTFETRKALGEHRPPPSIPFKAMLTKISK